MARISKRLISKHEEAMKLLNGQDSWSVDEYHFIYENFHEGVGMSNNMISAHFTPYELARHGAFCMNYTNSWVDLGAGIGIITYALMRFCELNFDQAQKIVCVERAHTYYEIGKKLLPNVHWICGDMFDIEVISEIKKFMGDTKFSVVSNPPYGRMVKVKCPHIKYRGANFEYSAIELGAILGADDGAFLIPQTSCPFQYSGQQMYKNYISEEYKKFNKQTGLEIDMNMGIDTSQWSKDWKEVSIVTEWAQVDYSEYVPNTIRERIKEKAKTAKIPIPGGYKDPKPDEDKIDIVDGFKQYKLF